MSREERETELGLCLMSGLIVPDLVVKTVPNKAAAIIYIQEQYRVDDLLNDVL